jgi:hypothetical protein
VLASSLAFDVIEFYRKLVVALKPSEIDLIPFASFDTYCALWPSNRCSNIVFKINDALALRLDQTGTLNLGDDTINIFYQKHIVDSTSGVRVYAFLHALLKKAKRQLHDNMPTTPDIEQATIIGSFGLNLEKYYLQFGTTGVSFDENIQSRFFLYSLQQKDIEIDRFVDHLDNVPEKDALPEELTLTELILRIKDIGSLQNLSPAIINRFTHSTPDSSSPHQHDCPLTSLATRMHVPTRVAKLDLITALLALIPVLLVRSVNAHRCSAFVAAGATRWTIVNRLRCTS